MREMRFFRILLLCLLIFPCLQPLTGRAFERVFYDDHKIKLWSASKDGETKGYLLSTIHYYRPGIWRDVPGLKTVMASGIRRLVIESSIDYKSNPDFLLGGPATFGHLSDADLKQEISEVFESTFGQPVNDRLRLWMIAIMLVSELYDFLPSDTIFDYQLANYVTTRNIPYFTLESAEELNHVMDRIPVATLQEGFRELLDALNSKRAGAWHSPEAIEHAYWHGGLVDGFMTKTPHDIQATITARNQAWLPAIKHHLSQELTIIAVGDSHLYGEQGLLQLLSDQGYILTPVRGYYYDYQPWPTCVPGDEPTWLNTVTQHTGKIFDWMKNQMNEFYRARKNDSQFVRFLSYNPALLPIATGVTIGVLNLYIVTILCTKLQDYPLPT